MSPYPLGSRHPGGECEICGTAIRATYNYRTGRHATRCRSHASVGRKQAAPTRWDLVERVRAEIERDGVDAFVRRRVMDQDMPLRLMRRLADAPVVEDERTIDRNPSIRPTWSPERLAVLDGIVRGLLNKQIAAERGVSIETVKTQIKAIYAMLGADNRAQAVSIAHRLGMAGGITAQA